MKNKNKIKKQNLPYKDIVIIFIGVFTLEFLSRGFHRFGEYLIWNKSGEYNLSWLYNPWTHDMGFVGTPSLIAVLINSIIISFVSGKRGIINATIIGTLNGSYWALINVTPYNGVFMSTGYILAMLQIIPYYMVISFIGGLLGKKIYMFFNKKNYKD